MANVRKLIRSYRANDCLWNDKSSAYYNVALRESAWRRIAYIFKDLFTIDQLKSQIRKLKKYYIHECLAIQNSRVKGYSYVPRYSFFKDLCFLPAMKSHHSANELMGMAPKCQVGSMIHTRSEQQLRAKMRDDQINCIIEDAFLLDNSRDRIPSVHVDFCTKPAYKSHKCSALNEDELEASHEMGAHYSMETNLGDIEQENYNFCKLIQNQNQKMNMNDNASDIRAVSGTDRWYPTEHCVSCGENKCDDDEWKDFLITDLCGERTKGTKKSRIKNNRKRNYNQSDSTINSKCECMCVCDSKEEISISSSKWKYESNNDIPSDFDNDTYTMCETKGPSIKHDKGNRYDGNNCGGSNSNQSYNFDHDIDPCMCGTNTVSSKYGSSNKSNSNRSYKCDEDNWSQCKEEGSNLTDSLYSNWPGPKLCGQSRPKQYVARCKVFPRGGKGHEKQCSGHWRRNNQILCQRLKEELALQKQNDNDGYRKQLKPCPNITTKTSWEQGRRRSSGAEKNSEELATSHYNNGYREQYPQQPPCGSVNCPANKYQYPQQSRPIYMQSARQKLDAQQNYQCQQKYNEPIIVPCPVHYPNYDYQQLRQSRQSQPPQQMQQLQQSQQSQPPPVQANYPPDIMNSMNENECECESNSAVEQLEECTPTAITPTPQSLNDLGEQQIEQPNTPEELIDEIDTRETVPCHRQCEDNENHPKYLVCLPVKDDRHSEYDPCSSYQRTHEGDGCYEERQRESCRSRRRHHRNEPERDRDMEYVLCPVYKDRRQRRRSDDYRDEYEFSPRRENDHEFLECTAYREGSSRRRHSYEEESHSERPRCRKYEERDDYADDCPHRERKSRDYDGYDEDYRRRRSQSHRNQIDSPKKSKKEEHYYCEKKECPATKRLRSEQTSKTAAEESRRRRSSLSSRNRSPTTSKGRPSLRKGQFDDDTEMEGGEQDTSHRRVSDPCRGNTQDRPKSGKCRRSSSQKKRRSATDDEMKNAQHSELSTESKMVDISKDNPCKYPKMCEAAVETDLDMSLRGRKCAKPQNRCTQIDCCCSLDNIEDPENVLCECEEAVTTNTVPRGHGGLSQKPDYNSKRLSQRLNNTNGLQSSSPGKAVTHSNSPSNRKRQRSGFENMSKWNNGFTIQPPNSRITNPVILKSFLIPPMVAKATMGIIHNHISNFNQLLQNPQGLANKPMVRCLRRKPIPKPSRKNQLSDHKAVVLTRNPFKSIDFNASKREVIVLHPPVKDFRPSKNSFAMADVEVKKLNVSNTEKVVETQKRVRPKPPPTKPKRTNH